MKSLFLQEIKVMAILRKVADQHFIYENEEQGILVAIEKDDTTLIKKYWKKNKGKKTLEEDLISGYNLVLDEEHQSLKIDFSEKVEHPIKFLKKFNG